MVTWEMWILFLYLKSEETELKMLNNTSVYEPQLLHDFGLGPQIVRGVTENSDGWLTKNTSLYILLIINNSTCEICIQIKSLG